MVPLDFDLGIVEEDVEFGRPGFSVIEEAFGRDAGHDPGEDFAGEAPEGFVGGGGLAVEPAGEGGGVGHAGEAEEAGKGGVFGEASGIGEVDAAGAQAQEDLGDDALGGEAAGEVGAVIENGEGFDFFPETEVAGEGVDHHGPAVGGDVIGGLENDVGVGRGEGVDGGFHDPIIAPCRCE